MSYFNEEGKIEGIYKVASVTIFRKLNFLYIWLNYFFNQKINP